MEASQAPQIQKIRALVSRLESGAALKPDEYKDMLETFERYECWNPYFRLIKRNLADPNARTIDDYLHLTRVQNMYLEDLFAAAETFSAMVSEVELTYQKIRDELLPQIIEPEDFTAEATLLHATWDRFSSREDQIQCLERLCMLYEKKTHNETQLAQTYETLREVEPHNVKALRYFKMVYTQNNDWESVVRTLVTLLESVKHPQELFRVAQELAAIFLYQLDMAKEAIDVLDRYCADSPLDTSTIRYDAYYRLGDWKGSLRVLREALLNVDDDCERSILHHKIAQLHEQLQEFDDALHNYEKSAELWTSFLDPIEGVITITLAKKDWATVQKWLNILTERVKNEELEAQLKQAIQRLADGLSHASSE